MEGAVLIRISVINGPPDGHLFHRLVAGKAPARAVSHIRAGAAGVVDMLYRDRHPAAGKGCRVMDKDQAAVIVVHIAGAGPACLLSMEAEVVLDAAAADIGDLDQRPVRLRTVV